MLILLLHFNLKFLHNILLKRKPLFPAFRSVSYLWKLKWIARKSGFQRWSKLAFSLLLITEFPFAQVEINPEASLSSDK